MNQRYLLLLGFFVLSFQPSLIAQDQEDSIKKVIMEETNAFLAKDYQKWASCWAHEAYVRNMGYYPAGGVRVIQGWDELSKRMQKNMETNPTPSEQKTSWRNFNLQIKGSIAWVTFDQIGVDSNGDPFDMEGVSHETRILELRTGKWLIVYANWLLEN